MLGGELLEQGQRLVGVVVILEGDCDHALTVELLGGRGV
jgi:hypothetical protein